MKQNKLFILSVVTIIVGTIMLFWNTYSFSKGYLSGSRVEGIAMENPIVENKTIIEGKLTGEKLGTLTIPKLKRSYPIFHGTNKDVLDKGVGHYPGSAFPGENSNTVLSGHRDTVFRELRHLKENDSLIVTTTSGKFIYKIRNIRIVDEDDRTVIVPKPKATLTVTTCYPFYFIGDTKERYILVADLITSSKS